MTGGCTDWFSRVTRTVIRLNSRDMGCSLSIIQRQIECYGACWVLGAVDEAADWVMLPSGVYVSVVYCGLPMASKLLAKVSTRALGDGEKKTSS